MRRNSPYVGVVPYLEDDADYFFGRETLTSIVAMNLRSTRLTILHGPGGVGKSSLLMAGVVRRLREDRRAPCAVCVFQSWSEKNPEHALQEQVRAALRTMGGAEPLSRPADSLAETFRGWTARNGSLLIVLDQFEEYFLYHPNEIHANQLEGRQLRGFARELAGIVNEPKLPVNVLISIREDAMARLDRFKGQIPSLYANSVRLPRLDVSAADDAIRKPIETWNEHESRARPFLIEDGLVEAVLIGTAAGKLHLTPLPLAHPYEAPNGSVEAPFLQLVQQRLWHDTTKPHEVPWRQRLLERLWHDPAVDRSHVLTLVQLEAIGGAGSSLVVVGARHRRRARRAAPEPREHGRPNRRSGANRSRRR